MSAASFGDEAGDRGGRRGVRGKLVPLKTTLELRAADATIEVFVTVVEGKKASGTLNLVKTLIPDDGGLDLGHLRRFIQFEDVQEGVRRAFWEARTALKKQAAKTTDMFELARKPEPVTPVTGSEVTAVPALPSGPKEEHISSTLADPSALSTSSQPARDPKKLFMIVGSINAISHSTLVEELERFVGIGSAIVFPVPVPHLQPTSTEQATRWTNQYWPTVYKKNNPFGPHPSIVSRAQREVDTDVERWMTLAWEVARRSKEEGYGEKIGVVVVERHNGIARPIAIAGDGRWVGWKTRSGGNVTAHSTLRAIAMVAKGVRDRRMGELNGDLVDAIPTHDSDPKNQKDGVRDDIPTMIVPGVVDVDSSGLWTDRRCGDGMIDNIPHPNVDPSSKPKGLAKGYVAESSDQDLIVAAPGEVRNVNESRYEHGQIVSFEARCWENSTTQDGASEDFADPRKDIANMVQENRKPEHVGSSSFSNREDRELEQLLISPNIDTSAMVTSTKLMISSLGAGDEDSQATPAVLLVESKSKDRAGGKSRADSSKSQAEPAGIAAKRQVSEGAQTHENSKLSRGRELFQDQPMLEIEERHLDPLGTEKGYLCHDLEIYCTHEPCIMCSMAIIHSRFGRVVFERRMQTGGLCADGELGHGLFWRKELNWTMLAWHLNRGPEGEQPTDPDLHA